MKSRILLTLAAAAFLGACGNDQPAGSANGTAADSAKAELREETLRYKADTTNCNSFIVYDKARSGTQPVVLVLPEWWGLNDYPKMRARELAKLGYVAMAVDMFGEGRHGDNPEAAGALAGPFYKDTALVRSRLSAAMTALRNVPQADTSRVVMIGYCFGGSMSLTAAKLGLPLKGAASFHGGLKGTASANAPVLVCHGEADAMVPAADVTAWRKTMDSLKADYTFRSYAGATHAFSNPDATENGKKFKLPIAYNAAADSASWAELQTFLKKVF
jgi:dienelactone hydrolase